MQPADVTDFGHLLRCLHDAGVEYIVIGGVAAKAHGSAHFTVDLDVCYRRTRENHARLAAALSDLRPYLRGAPPGLPFALDAPTLERGANFTLTTLRGDVDLLGYVTGGGTYDELVRESFDTTLFDVRCKCINLATLIRVKRAAGRPKDFERVAELDAILRERRGEEP